MPVVSACDDILPARRAGDAARDRPSRRPSLQLLDGDVHRRQAILGLVLTHIHGFSKVLGLMHAPWIPMIAVQVASHPGFGANDAYVIWLTAAILISTVCVIVDVIDVVTFLRSTPAEDAMPATEGESVN